MVRSKYAVGDRVIIPIFNGAERRNATVTEARESPDASGVMIYRVRRDDGHQADVTGDEILPFRVEYVADADGSLLVDAELQTAATIRKLLEPPPEMEAAVTETARAVLYAVLRVFRPDLFVDGPPRPGRDTLSGEPWLGVPARDPTCPRMIDQYSQALAEASSAASAPLNDEQLEGLQALKKAVLAWQAANPGSVQLPN